MIEVENKKEIYLPLHSLHNLYIYRWFVSLCY